MARDRSTVLWVAGGAGVLVLAYAFLKKQSTAAVNTSPATSTIGGLVNTVLGALGVKTATGVAGAAASAASGLSHVSIGTPTLGGGGSVNGVPNATIGVAPGVTGDPFNGYYNQAGQLVNADGSLVPKVPGGDNGTEETLGGGVITGTDASGDTTFVDQDGNVWSIDPGMLDNNFDPTVTDFGQGDTDQSGEFDDDGNFLG